MPIGQGKYDDTVTKLREELEADAVVVLVIGGSKGHGFSCQAPPEIIKNMPDMFEAVAHQMRKDLSNNLHPEPQTAQ